jgi:hypothetical protein
MVTEVENPDLLEIGAQFEDVITNKSGANTITLYAAKGEMFWPIRTIDVSALIEQGYDQRFMLAWSGHIDQSIIEPSEWTTSTPHDREPEQPPILEGYGGKPALVGRREVETITLCFKTEQS